MATYEDDPQTGSQTGAEPAQELGHRLDVLADQAGEFIREQAAEHPYRTVLAAAAVGYVLGAGVPNWAIRLGVNAATRMAVAAAIAQVAGSED